MNKHYSHSIRIFRFSNDEPEEKYKLQQHTSMASVRRGLGSGWRELDAWLLLISLVAINAVSSAFLYPCRISASSGFSMLSGGGSGDNIRSCLWVQHTQLTALNTISITPFFFIYHIRFWPVGLYWRDAWHQLANTTNFRKSRRTDNSFQPTVLTIVLMVQCCVCRLWRYVLWLNDAS